MESGDRTDCRYDSGANVTEGKALTRNRGDVFSESALCTDCRYKLSLFKNVEPGFVGLRFVRWNSRRVFEAFIPTVGTEGSERRWLWDQIRTRLFRWHGCRGARVLRFNDEECLDSPSEEGGFTTRANASEAMHSSYLSGLGGKKMQLEITTAVLTTGAAMLNQMAEAKAKKETLAKRSEGPTLEDNERQRWAFKKRVENLKGDLEEGKGFNEKVEAFNKAVEDEGFACPPVGIEKIDTRTRRKRHGTERGDKEEEWEGTHRADRSRSEVVKRKVVRVNLSDEDSADEGGTGIHKDVFAKVGDITEEDIRGQKGDLERLERERVEKERARKGRRKDDESESELGGGEEEYNRLLAEMKKESAKKRKRGGDGGEKGERVEGEEKGEEESEDKEKRKGEGAGKNKGKRISCDEEISEEATRFVTEWGVAKLKGVDLAECAQWGVGQGRKAVQEGAQQGSEGKLRRKRGAYEVSVIVVGCCI
jgi:hypothetical protein